MSERDIQRDIVMKLSNGQTRLWHMQAGKFRALHSDEIIHVGVPGMSDLFGPRSIVVTQDMVGKRIAVFAAIEVKGDRGRANRNQLDFIQVVDNLGGYAGIARSVDEARAILRLK
jgi:hypothetical protein